MVLTVPNRRAGGNISAHPAYQKLDGRELKQLREAVNSKKCCVASTASSRSGQNPHI